MSTVIGSRRRLALGFALGAALLLACSDDDNDPNQPPPGAGFADVQAVLTEDCGTCHGAASGRIFRTTLDSTALVNSGLLDPANPGQSLLLLKPTNATAHAGGAVATFSSSDQTLISAWIEGQPAASTTLRAVRLPVGTAAPVINGYFDPAWNLGTVTTYQIGGGWADASNVAMTALYDDTYLYVRISWSDDAYSDRRQPWVKQSDGSWLVLPAKTPTPTPGLSWQEYMGAGFDEENLSRFNYEDKLAVMWNTYGASTVAGFDQAGCAVTCHDPLNGEGPGTTYNYSDESQAAKKFTSNAGEIADLWHWKMVRNNQHLKLDDQVVRNWVRGVNGAANGGRGSDAGAAGYGSNPATNGAPTYRGPTTTVPPYYIFDNQKVTLTPQELAAFPTGQEIPNMITSGPTGVRADVDAVGYYNSSTNQWIMEIRRQLVTNDVDDVQFDDLSRTYSFGVAVFDNAQIEHSYMSAVGKLVFQP